ncbi:hypothetical protein [Streptomyces sp. NBC_00151]|uniref:hypothetical protein n=1 Tax=Streptomyces sp. NBC_00151 TaxID=2975669 RepID=UPI002DD96375|nr:hypothetical protein [Streptomyces sp. NBC_00151]WRZ40099.1 hypothetical protein OG915_19850 [Streptomyces sp. NBC_00151]
MTALHALAATQLAVKSKVTDELDYVLDMIAWLVTAAGVAGLMIVGSRMALAVKTGEFEEHLNQFLMVLGACVIGATAGPIVGFVL